MLKASEIGYIVENFIRVNKLSDNSSNIPVSYNKKQNVELAERNALTLVSQLTQNYFPSVATLGYGGCYLLFDIAWTTHREVHE